jgi:glycosyltransferase involved in cell wall biosynthesis
MEEVKIHYQASDFSIILRENKRYAVAGFPTKFVESIACGVPVIANKVGDIEAYITKFEVGFLVDNKDILNDLLSVLSLYAKNSSLKKKIQKKCYHLARDKFLFDNYTETMKKVL